MFHSQTNFPGQFQAPSVSNKAAPSAKRKGTLSNTASTDMVDYLTDVVVVVSVVGLFSKCPLWMSHTLPPQAYGIPRPPDISKVDSWNLGCLELDFATSSIFLFQFKPLSGQIIPFLWFFTIQVWSWQNDSIRPWLPPGLQLCMLQQLPMALYSTMTASCFYFPHQTFFYRL